MPFDPLDPIARIRRFNRAVTRETGALDSSFLGRGRPLGAARVLHLVTPDGTDVADIRQALNLDSGLLSRLLRSLEAEGLIATDPHPDDRRQRIARLLPKGAAERAAYERLSNAMAAGVLSRARDEGALLAAMDLIATTLNRDHIAIAAADPLAPQATACLAAYAALLAEKVEGFTPADFPLPLPDPDSYRPPNGAFLLASSDTLPLACVCLRRLDATTGEVKRLWVHPDARGQGLARRMMLAIEAQARALGYRRLKLDTNQALTEAIALYHATGWTPTEAYSGFPSTHWFTKPL